MPKTLKLQKKRRKLTQKKYRGGNNVKNILDNVIKKLGIPPENTQVDRKVVTQRLRKLPTTVNNMAECTIENVKFGARYTSFGIALKNLFSSEVGQKFTNEALRINSLRNPSKIFIEYFIDSLFIVKNLQNTKLKEEVNNIKQLYKNIPDNAIDEVDASLFKNVSIILGKINQILDNESYVSDVTNAIKISNQEKIDTNVDLTC
jgi:hypothetical protein